MLSSLLSIFRVPNLLVVALTLWTIAYSVIYPTLHTHQIEANLSFKDFYLLLFLTICVAAGGYLHNDISDGTTDRINQKRSFIDEGWEKQLALIGYAVITIAPIPFALSLAMEIDHPEYMWIYFGSVALIWLYNRYIKKWPLIGNVLVAGLCAGVVLLLLIAEREPLAMLKTIDTASYEYITQIVIFYGGFAFFTTLLREIVKDIEDIKGDQYIGAHTLPISIGVPKTKQSLIFLHLAVQLFLGYWLFYLGGLKISWMWIGIAIVLIPSFYLLYLLITAHETSDYGAISQWYKIWMIIGLFYLILYCTT